MTTIWPAHISTPLPIGCAYSIRNPVALHTQYLQNSAMCSELPACNACSMSSVIWRPVASGSARSDASGLVRDRDDLGHRASHELHWNAGVFTRNWAPNKAFMELV